MRDGDTGGEYSVLRIVRAHAHGFIQMDNRLLGLAVEGKCPAEVAMRCRKVRVELQGTLEFPYRFGHAPRHEGDIPLREVRPRIALIEFRCSHRELRRLR